MILSVYIVLVILGYLLFILGLMNARPDKENKVILFNTLLLLSFIVFIAVSYSSVYITQDFCFNQVSEINYTSNTSIYGSEIICQTQIYEEIALAWIFGIQNVLIVALIVMLNLINIKLK